MHIALWRNKLLVTECIEESAYLLEFFPRGSFRMDKISGILLKMNFSVGPWNKKENKNKKTHCIVIRSLCPFPLPFKEEGFILIALVSGLSCIVQGEKPQVPASGAGD